ncbi:AMP-binding protein [Williamsia deligens]|uniref:AMP-binding protein n=1 Tax=Williamsia deligens TaxID=321325 RepID=A0ABW3G3H0_9NOCA|nr:AMP-binding protein [Williamsia deligens]MCP2194654.1 fatty-acyl-CoA synthase [Williamsia deligens]
MAQNLADLFEHAVDAVPDRVAVVDAGTPYTFSAVEARANRLAHLLAERGVTAGDHVGVHMHNDIDALCAFLASYKLRAAAVNVNHRYRADEARHVYSDATVRAVLTQPGHADVAEAAAEGLDTEVIVTGADLDTALENFSADRDFGPRADDDRFLMYTGGTTGAPKGVIWHHCDIWRVLGGGIDFYSGELLADERQQSRSAAESAAAGATQGMRFLMLPPLIHVSGLMPSLGALFSGNTVMYEPRFDASSVWDVVMRQEANILVITGDAMALPLIEEARTRAAAGTPVVAPSLLAISSGAALFSPALKRQMLEVMPTAAISDSIGSSETGFGGITVYSAADTSFADSAYSGGPRVPAGRGATVIDDDGAPVSAPGEGWFAKTGYLPVGYLNDPAKTATIFREHDGVRMVVSGDRARIDTDGTITLLGRGSQVVNTGGEKVFVEEVEGHVKSHPSVVDATVVGIPDDRFGHRVAAVVSVSGSALDVDDLDAHLRNRLAGYKIPRAYWVVDTVLRTPSGKPDYRWANDVTATTDPTHDRLHPAT